MRERRNSEIERRTQSNPQSRKKSQYKTKQNKQKKKKSKAPFIACLILGIGIGWAKEFDIKDFIENISKYKLVIAKKDDSQEVIHKKETKVDEIKDEKVEVEKQQSKQAQIEEKKSESPKPAKKEVSNEDKIKKAKQSIIEQCGDEFSDVIYTGKTEFKGGQYYCFGINVGGGVGGDMTFLVDKTTYKAYESSVDGYFGKYRGDNSDEFTYDMAVRRLENELGFDERRTYTLVEEGSEGYEIRTSFIAEPGSGEGLYYVTPDFLDICLE